MEAIKLPAKVNVETGGIYDADDEFICSCTSTERGNQIVAALNAQQPKEGPSQYTKGFRCGLSFKDTAIETQGENIGHTIFDKQPCQPSGEVCAGLLSTPEWIVAGEEHIIISRQAARIDALEKACSGAVILSGDELEALQSMASVAFMVKACAGSLSPTDVAESINGIINSSRKKTKAALGEALEKALDLAAQRLDYLTNWMQNSYKAPECDIKLGRGYAQAAKAALGKEVKDGPD